MDASSPVPLSFLGLSMHDFFFHCHRSIDLQTEASHVNQAME